MSNGHEQAAGATADPQPNEEEMRAAYEAELNRITSSEMILQTAVSLLNIGGRRLGLGSPPTSPENPAPGGGERDLEQVRDAIDGASALLPILERRMPGELGPLRDAVAQLQVAYAREAQGAGNTTPVAGHATPAAAQAPAAAAQAPAAAAQAAAAAAQAPAATQAPPAKPREKQEPPTEGEQGGPGPAQASGRLWVPGR